MTVSFAMLAFIIATSFFLGWLGAKRYYRSLIMEAHRCSAELFAIFQKAQRDMGRLSEESQSLVNDIAKIMDKHDT